MAGHLVGLARTDQEEHVLMGGDCCHHRKIFKGEANVAEGEGRGPGGSRSMHNDLNIAKSTIAKVHDLGKRDDTLVCLAHDGYLEPSIQLLPAFINGWKKSGAKDRIERDICNAVLDVQQL